MASDLMARAPPSAGLAEIASSVGLSWLLDRPVSRQSGETSVACGPFWP
jgi:hypothetical protein